MNYTRPLLLATSALALLISACSQPADIQGPTLEPQYGTAKNDFGEHVAANSEGVYIGGAWNAKTALIKFSRSGRLPWLAEIALKAGDQGNRVRDVALTPSGHALVLYESSFSRFNDDGEGVTTFRTHYLREYAPDGELIRERKLTNASSSTRAVGLDVDKASNVYVAFNGAAAGVYKYRADGTLLWRKAVSGDLLDLQVSPNGFAFVTALVSDVSKLTRYAPNGALLWSRTLSFFAGVGELADGREGEVYVLGNNGDFTSDGQLAAYDAKGVKRWQRAVAGVDALAADALGNVYVAGASSDPETNDSITTVQKYGPSGSETWTYRTVTPPLVKSLSDMAVVSPSEVYVVGSTLGEVNGVNNGEFDGFVLRLDGQGKRVWER